MIDIENTTVYGWDTAIRGMRNPLNSWENGDTLFDDYGYPHNDEIGAKDLSLMKQLAQSGTDHGKFLRMIIVSCDITAPLYWWKQFDTYKIGVSANSCSTMHKIHAKPFEIKDFSTDGMTKTGILVMQSMISELEALRRQYNDWGDKKAWRTIIQLLPECYNQRRTVMLNYQALSSMYKARKAHKLEEWHSFCNWALELPYFAEITGIE